MKRHYYYATHYRQAGPDGGGVTVIYGLKHCPQDTALPQVRERLEPDSDTAKLAAMLANVADPAKWDKAMEIAASILKEEAAIVAGLKVKTEP